MRRSNSSTSSSAATAPASVSDEMFHGILARMSSLVTAGCASA